MPFRPLLLGSWLSAVLSCSQTAHAEPACADAGHRFVQRVAESATDFNPEALLLSHGLDPEKVTFVLEDHNDGYRMLRAVYDGRPAGYIITTPALGESGVYPIVEKVELSNDFKGKGLGAILYTALAHKIYGDGEGLLTRSELVSPDAIRFWNRLLHLGYAETSESMYGEIVRMKKSVVADLAGKVGWEFVKERLQAP